MAGKLPYYPHYPADFMESEKVLAMNLSEVGLYQLSLDYAWIHGYIPDDPKELARLIRHDAAAVRKAWPKVRPCWVENGSPGRLVNERQEQERAKALRKSSLATSAVRTRYVRSTDVDTAVPTSDSSGVGTNEHIRAYGSVSGSEKEKKDELFSLDEPPFDPPWEEEVERVTERIWKRHGAFRRCAREVVKAKLRTICMDVPEPERVAALQYIDIQHEKMKRSEDWTKDGGAYIKGLDAWLNPKNRLWENEPRSSVKVEAHNPYRLVDSLGEGGAA